jgi:hypothetical protein
LNTSLPGRFFLREAISGLSRCATAALLCATVSASAASDENTPAYYRLDNGNGTTVLKAAITAAEAKRGYTVINRSGRVIETVAPELTAEQYAALSEEKKRELEKEKNQAEALAYDESLLLRYSTIEDLEAERKRKLFEFDYHISILRSNMASLKNQVERQQLMAANIERRGAQVPLSIQKNIIDLQEKIDDAEHSLASRQQEKHEMDLRYDADAERFQQLMELRDGLHE